MRRLGLAGGLGAFVLAALTLWGADTASSPASKVRVLLVTGGHDFEQAPFFQMFKDNPQITVESVQHPKAHARLTAEAAAQWDVLVLYDMWQDITEEAKADLVSRLREGKGLVALHHCLCSYQKWDEYARIIGGKYHLEKRTENGVAKPASTYLHDVDFTVRVADAEHPVTRGVKDFSIHDETYGGFETKSTSHALLTTDHPTSSPTVGWAHNYERARVVYLQLGHDHFAYENPNYRRLVAQAIWWTAKRDPETAGR